MAAVRGDQNGSPEQLALSLLDRLGAVGAAGWIVLYRVVLIRAVAVIAGLADAFRYGGELERVVLILVVDRRLGAAGDGENVARLVAAGGERGIKKLRTLGRW